MSKQTHDIIFNRKRQNSDSSPEPPGQYEKNQRNKDCEAYRSYFFRNNKDQTEHSSQTKIKSRLKSTRVKNKIDEHLRYELQSTKRQDDCSLREENILLKKTIAELKIMQLYQIDQKKVRELLQQIEDMKRDIKKLKKENQKLRIQNDFLNRTNFQLKLQITKLTNREENYITQVQIASSVRNTLPQSQYLRLLSLTSSSQIPKHLLLSNKKIKYFQTSKQENEQLSTPFLTPQKQKIIEDLQKYNPPTHKLGHVYSQRNLKINGTSMKSSDGQRAKSKRLVSLAEEIKDRPSCSKNG